jgi:hypothetical protein
MGHTLSHKIPSNETLKATSAGKVYLKTDFGS